MRITYKATLGGYLSVYLDKKKVGRIKAVLKNNKIKYCYQPANSSQQGDMFDTLNECKKSIEGRSER